MQKPDWDKVSDDDIMRRVTDLANRNHVAQVLRSLTPDANWTERIVAQLQATDRGPVAEIRCFLSWLTAAIRPATYLEIGVRRGFSAAVVASRAPQVDIYGFDLWVRDYAGSANPGPGFVSRELNRAGHRGKCFFFTGNSHQTIPAFFRPPSCWSKARRWALRQPAITPASFDLITVDGDHSLTGAYHDLLNVMGRCSVGGAVVFDDIAPDIGKVGSEAIRRELGVDPNGHQNLHGVWNAVKKRFPMFRYFDFTAQPPGVGIAIRMG